MAYDPHGNEVTLAAMETLGGIHDFVAGFLGYQARAANILASAQSDPETPLAQVYAGMVAMFADRPDASGVARRYLESARKTLSGANRREAMNFALLEAWIANDVPKALTIGEEIVDEFPTDLVALKLHQTFSFNMGNAPEMLRIARKGLPANPDNPHLHAMLAFGYEQCHFLDKAEAAAYRALELDRTEPWAHHAIAHVMLTEGRVPEGISFLKDASGTWRGLNSFMYTHNWWHLALFEISTGDFDRVLEAYDTHCWGIDKTYSQDQIGAVSLLARMELAGIDVGDRWSDVAAHLKTRANDTLQPFMTMQYLYGLARGGLPEADALMRAVRERAASAPPFEKTPWAEVALPACEGLIAHARGRYEEAIAGLSRAMPRMMEIGGSHAQRDLFAQVLLDAHFKAGNFVTAQQMLESRRRYDPNGVPLNRMLARTYEKLGLLDEAGEAASRHY